jgi:ribonuclease P protein component
MVRQGGLKLFYSTGSPGPARVAVCNGRGFRTAVDRNRSKRVSREAMRIFQERLVPGVDMALVGYPSDTLQTCLSRRQDQLRVLLERAELLEPRR